MTEIRGKTTFDSQRDALFRFSVSSEKIWLEQQATKQQWQCTVSSVDDFALKGAGIPHAIVMDSLAMSLGRSKASRDIDYEVDLIAMSNDRMRLDFLLKLSNGDVMWKPEYQFVLQPIAVTETQMLLAKLQDANDNLQRLHSIIPAWVMETTDCAAPRNEAAMQIVALKGTQSWLYLCGLVKRVMENPGTRVESAVEWSTTAAHKSGEVVAKYWPVLQERATQATDALRHILLQMLEDTERQTEARQVFLSFSLTNTSIFV